MVDIEDDEKKDEKLNSLITELKGNYIRFKKYKTFFRVDMQIIQSVTSRGGSRPMQPMRMRMHRSEFYINLIPPSQVSIKNQKITIYTF